MRTRFYSRVVLPMLLTAAAHSEILDRIAVTVGKQVITESDVIRDLRISEFLDQKPVDLSGEQKRKAADRLVDQLLMLQEAGFTRATLPAADDGAALVQQVKSLYKSESDFRTALERYHITEEELANHLLAGARAMRFADLRFRPEIQISEDDLHESYNTIVAESKRANAGQIPTFEESRDQIERLLTDQRVSQTLDRWLGTQRNEVQIIYRELVFK
jgi:hypothetical protein